MRALLNPLRVRLILGSLLFLLGLTGAIVLVVRDSLLFSARNMTEAAAQALLQERQASLLEIARREAELADHAVHHDPPDTSALARRLQGLPLTSNGFAFVMDGQGKLVAASSGRIESLAGSAGQDVSLLDVEDPLFRDILQRMQGDESGATQMELGADPVVIAYAPLEEMGWSLAIVEPVAGIAAGAGALSEEMQSGVDSILQATLITIAYFAVIAVIGAVIAARAMTGPIETLMQGTQAVTAGDLSVRIPVRSSDELGVLAESFNRMADELSRRTEEAERINASLLKSEERFRLAIEAAPNAMVMGNEAGRIVLVNRQAELLFGDRREEMVGQPVELLVSERFYEVHGELRDRFLHQPQARPTEVMRSMFGRRRDGSEFPAEVAYNPIETEEGILILGSIVDISERQQLAEARIQAAVEERQRLARELHDSVTQSLYSLTLLAEASRRTARSGQVPSATGSWTRTPCRPASGRGCATSTNAPGRRFSRRSRLFRRAAGATSPNGAGITSCGSSPRSSSRPSWRCWIRPRRGSSVPEQRRHWPSELFTRRANSAIAALGLYAVLQAVDGVALKQAVDAWAAAPQTEKADRFASAEAVRWLEWAVRSYHSFM